MRRVSPLAGVLEFSRAGGMLPWATVISPTIPLAMVVLVGPDDVVWSLSRVERSTAQTRETEVMNERMC